MCTVPLDSCSDITDIRKSATWEGDIHKINETFEKSFSWLDYPIFPKLLLFGF